MFSSLPLVLTKALEIDRLNGDESGFPSLIGATRGIVFLATPFRGTAFQDMPRPSLAVWGLFRDQIVTALMDYTREPTPNTEELVDNFIELRQEQR